jgi:predicted Zn-dependent peptidase
MRIAVELEFPDNRAAAALQWLQSLPADVVAHFVGRKQAGLVANPATEELSEAEQYQLLHEVFGSWQSDESSEELVRSLYADRQDQPREVDL